MNKMEAKWRRFAQEYCSHGDRTKAYMTAYPNAKDTTARVKSYDMLRKPEVQQFIREYTEMADAVKLKVMDKVEARAVERLADKLVTMILTADQKKEILRQIAMGELREKTYKPVWEEDDQGNGKWVSKLVAIAEPTMQDRLKAIEIHNKMTGDNAPDKLQHSVDKGVEDYILEE